ncbi:hypothetical protein SAMN05421823_102414 [Catalinimonas alkaloidigena]|uniref:Nitroimidazol reductase NimA, pyridoxamine 5'-phosphate oxidase superfamily n=1 Tax=Catalinimonas alkaloidigena TaxID=1075417 RepID=A0A1G9AUJ8_9BACT|nr:pyridoxamine 5'-phosphate oxidase family protein [Catalinimonas alkaloidigena]SDK30932.1 hypothetical protein SAMN05421823_102414 [Catalinimonas alkaloidigena]
MEQFTPSARSKVKRIPKRGAYDAATVYSILDAGCIAHVGFAVDQQPFVIPTIYGRENDTLYLHGATTSRMLQQLQRGLPICVTVTHVDGLVLARSAFHHSMNYRSVVVFGTATLVPDDEKMHALAVVSEQILKGRWEEVRLPNAKELKATSVVRVQIEEASAKIRTGDPGDEPEDYALPIWAGVVPMHTTFGPVQPDPAMETPLPTPASVAALYPKQGPSSGASAEDPSRDQA